MKNNTPAFPYVLSEGSFVRYENGMTLRDYFAAKAMQSIRSTAPAITYGNIAKYAYEMADAMLKARDA